MSTYAQSEIYYIEKTSNNKTFQLHSTLKDLSVITRTNDQESLVFRNHNWSTGFYIKWNLAELFVAIPLKAIDNKVAGSPKAFGTGFGLNFYPRNWHFNYNFKYIQGFESINQVWTDKLQTLDSHNFFLFNRLNSHYIDNPNFSLKAALRFNEKQLLSAGSLLLAFPMSYHYANVSSASMTDFASFSRTSVGAMAGYGYSYVYQGWSVSLILKGGLDFRYVSFESNTNWELVPSINVIASTVYHWDRNFMGIIYNDYPEYYGSGEVSFKVVNWKARIYIGKRF
ncbi:DUF4421 family protein [Portibacter marinus]|uniref:DUF4421 family protein n=1 Tax=Portibacter marinus TaxID=2898660 RepID=UPI001F1F9D2E|nr:DUF4421 family protein [Portibacter marinus]